MTHTRSAPSSYSPGTQAAAIAGAEEQLQMLRRLATLGMRLAEEVCERAIASPYHPQATHEPGRAFATVSRAVRLTLVLQAKVEAGLLALRNGHPVAPDRQIGSREEVGAGADPAALDDATADDLDDDMLETPDHPRESLVERERFDEILSRPFDECVAAIRSDLGLAPRDGAPSRPVLPLSLDGAKVFEEPRASMGQADEARAHDLPDTG